MTTFPANLGLALTLLAGAALGAQDLSPRMGFGAFLAQPTDSAGKQYGSGWKVNLTLHVRREATVEGRVRFELGEFREGKDVADWWGYQASRYRARTRLVGYDWLIPLGSKQPTGFDIILGIGGVHWYRDRTVYSLPGPVYNPGYSYASTEDNLAFAGTVGLRYRFSRNFEVELHQVITSTPNNHQDFSDAELSHTALGLSVRF